MIIAASPSNGTLYDDANSNGTCRWRRNGLGATDSVAAATIAAGRLKFKPVANANGTAYDSFTFQVQDDGGTANGGVDTDPSANTITIDVTSVNDAPVGRG